MFDALDMAPPDAIMGLKEAFTKDPNPNKINLSVGVYQDADGSTPILRTVKRAELRSLEQQQSKGYLPINGAPGYGVAVRRLVFGDDHEIIRSDRAVTAHTPGGTGGLRVAADFIKQKFPNATVWLSDPTWGNHPGIFAAAGVPTKKYPYYDADQKCLDFAAMVAGLKQVQEGDFVLLHGCCHNPTGMDPDLDQWQELANVAAKQKWTPFFDFAYQGFADGVQEDAAGLRLFLQPDCELMVCTSFSKNFGLYNERTGALTIVAGSKDAAQKALSHVKRCIRTNYSNPPAHGAGIVTTILNDPELSAEWEHEVAAMRDRINGVRQLLADTLKAKGVKQDFSFLTRQRGMFSFSGLTKEQVGRLREEYGIYIVVAGGRINVAGITEANVGTLCDALAEVLK
jgi:aspartate aminotransferase